MQIKRCLSKPFLIALLLLLSSLILSPSTYAMQNGQDALGVKQRFAGNCLMTNT